MFALRQLRRNRLFGVLVIALLAVGIGAGTLVFSLIDELILKPLPVRNPENLYLAETVRKLQVRPDTYFPYTVYESVFSNSAQAAAAVAEEQWSRDQLMSLTAGGAVRLVVVQMVSPNYFRELGLKPMLGGSPREPGAAILSYPFWQSEFAGRADIVGRTIRLKGAPFTVAGVLPREFHSSDIDRAPDVRVLAEASPSLNGFDIRDPRNPRRANFRILLRLASGVNAEQAAGALSAPFRDAKARALREANPYDPYRVSAAELEQEIAQDDSNLRLVEAGRGISQLRDQFSGALWLPLGGVVLLLFAVCTNVAGLLLARSATRSQELAIRSALGAGRWRLVRQLLAENLLLGVPGGLLGAALAWLGAPQVIRLLPPPRDYGQFRSAQLLAIAPDWRVFLFLAAATGACLLAFGMLPAWRASRASAWQFARGYSRSAAGLVPVALQVALSVVLLAGASLMLRTFRNLDRTDPGFDRDHIVSFMFDPADVGYTPARSAEFYQSLRDRASGMPGVRSAALAMLGVMRSVGMKMTVAPHGVKLPEQTFLNTSLNQVAPEYFAAMGIPLLAGRNLREEKAVKPLPVVVNRAFADFFFPGKNPLGQTFVTGRDGTRTPTHVIVGLCGTAKYRSLREPDPPTIYEPLQLVPDGNFTPLLYVRTWGDPSGIIRAVRKTATDLAPAVPLIEALTVEQEIQTSLWQERLLALLSGFFGIAAALLAALGLYGSLAQAVARRTRELGIRVAIGASFRHIVRCVCGPMAFALLAGLAAGLVASMLLLRFTARLLFGVAPRDPYSAGISVGVVVLCAVLAAAGPAWRAARTDPASALREE